MLSHNVVLLSELGQEHRRRLMAEVERVRLQQLQPELAGAWRSRMRRQLGVRLIALGRRLASPPQPLPSV